jgi:multidrug efflux pump subunit AcrA (membrane-fusion protein)
VEVKDGGGKGEIVVRRRDVTVTFTGIERVTTFNDPAADVGGKVLEITVPAGEMRAFDIRVTR